MEYSTVGENYFQTIKNTENILEVSKKDFFQVVAVQYIQMEINIQVRQVQIQFKDKGLTTSIIQIQLYLEFGKKTH